MARDRPSPYGNGHRFLGRIVLGPLGPKNRFFIVARGPVPRDRRGARARTMARDRPSPYGNARRFLGRIVLGPLGPKNRFFIVARGPSDATRASERVSPAMLSEL